MPSLIIISSCNQDCMHCSNPILFNKKESIETPKEKAFEQIIALAGSKKVVISGGGEPTTHPNLLEMISFAKKNRIESVGIQTNGVLLGDIEYVKKLKECGLDFCDISLHSHNELVSDRLTQAPGTFMATINGIKNVREQGIAFTTAYHTISKHNAEGFRDFLKFMHLDYGISWFIISYIRPLQGDEMSESITPRFSDVMGHLSNGFRYGKEEGLTIIVAEGLGIPPCKMSGFEEYCAELQDSKWTAREMKNIAYKKVKGDGCTGCRYYDACSGIHASYARLYGTSEFKAIKQSI